MAKNNDNRNKALSALITLLLGVATVGLLLFTSLHYEYPPKDADMQQLLQDSIIFGGEEYVELGDLLEPVPDMDLAANGEETPQESEAQNDEPQEVGQNDLKDQGAIDEPPRPQVQTKTQESPMKVKEQPPKKPQAEKKTEQQQPVKPQKKADPKEQTATKKADQPKPATPTAPNNEVNNRVKNAFGSSGGTGAGKQGSPNGTPGASTVGRPGVGGLEGYTLEYFPTSQCPGPGTVVVRVTVSPTGAVSKATVVGGSLRSNQKACNICLGLANKSRFRVPKGQNIERSGTLTYSIK